MQMMCQSGNATGTSTDGSRKARRIMKNKNISEKRQTMSEQNTTNKQSSTMGIGLGMILCGLVLLGFPKFADMALWLSWIFYAIGLLILLFGILGACIEKFK